MKSIYIFILLFFGGACGIAQPMPDGSSKNKKAQKIFLEAQNKAILLELDKALPLLEQALSKDPNFTDALFLRGDIYRMQRKFPEAIKDYQDVYRIQKDYSMALYNMALAALESGEYTIARNALELFMKTPRIHPDRMKFCETMLANAAFGEEAKAHPVPFQPKNLGPNINTSLKDYFPSITVDGTLLIFDRNENGDENFFISQRTPEGWGPAKRIEGINSTENESYATFTADGKYVFFVRFEQGNGLDIFFSSFQNNSWSKPQNLGAPINTRAWESQPCISPDGSTLYFTSNRPGGLGGSDIYMSKYDINKGSWSVPVNLGKKINTSGNDEAPFLHPDGNTFYFSSDGHPGMGGFDLYISRRQSDGIWQMPENAGYPINTPEDERSLFVAANGKEALITSGSLKGYGDWDIYAFDLPESLKPKQVTYVRGKTLDSTSGLPVSAFIELTDLKTGKVTTQTLSNKKNGEFMVVLNTGDWYAFNITSDKHLLYSETYQFNETGSNLKPVEKDFLLIPLQKGKSVVLKNVYFPTASHELQPESFAELNKLVAILKNKPNMTLELSGHTDNVGKKTDNLALSQRRAKSVMEYLISQGIAASRLTSIGYGDTLPRFDNGIEDGRKQNRRTEFKITGI